MGNKGEKMISKQTVFSTFLILLAISTFLISSTVMGHNENVPPVHTHVTVTWGVCTEFWPGSSTHEEGDCVITTTWGFFIYRTVTTCTHGVEEETSS